MDKKEIAVVLLVALAFVLAWYTGVLPAMIAYYAKVI